MSFKSFLQSVVSKIETLINHILPSSKHLLDLALLICNGLKTIQPELITIAALIPGTTDDLLVEKLYKLLPDIMTGLKLAQVEAGKSADQIVAEGVGELQKMESKVKSTTIQSIWKLLSDGLTDESVLFADLQTIAQSYYENSSLGIVKAVQSITPSTAGNL